MFFLVLLVLSIQSFLYGHVLIITFAYNRADVIAMQYYTFKKNLTDDFEYIIFNDAVDKKICEDIETMCKNVGIACYRIPQEIHRRPGGGGCRPSIRHGQGIDYALKIRGHDHDDIMAIVDGDMFLIRPFSIRQYIRGCDIASFIRTVDDVDFMWPGLTFIDMQRIPDKNTLSFRLKYEHKKPGDINNTADYLQKYPDLVVKPIDVTYGFELYCPYSRVPQYYSSRMFHLNNYNPYAPDARNTFLAYAQKYVDIARYIIPEMKHRTWDSYGFNEIEKKFLMSQPDYVDFFLERHFLHYQAVSNWNGLSAQETTLKTKAVETFIGDILNN